MDADADYGWTRFLLCRPRLVYSEARGLRDVLAVMQGYARGRYPVTRGDGYLPGFQDFVNRRFTAACCMYVTLMAQYGHLPGFDGCSAVLALLEEWKAERDKSPVESPPEG